MASLEASEVRKAELLLGVAEGTREGGRRRPACRRGAVDCAANTCGMRNGDMYKALSCVLNGVHVPRKTLKPLIGRSDTLGVCNVIFLNFSYLKLKQK